MRSEVVAASTLGAGVALAVLGRVSAGLGGPRYWAACAAATMFAARMAAGGATVSQQLRLAAAQVSYGRVAIVTGANSGIGYYTALELAKLGFTVVITARTVDKSRRAAARMRLEAGAGTTLDIRDDFALVLDDFASVRKFAAQFLSSGLQLHVLVNNAGFSDPSGLQFSGAHPQLEAHTAANFLGPVLLTELLMPAIQQCNGRVVVVASGAHQLLQSLGLSGDDCVAGLLELNEGAPSSSSNPPPHGIISEKSCRGGSARYALSKLCDVYYAHYVATVHRVPCASLCPGLVASRMWRNIVRGKVISWLLLKVLLLLFKTPFEGAQTSLHCALCPEAELTPSANLAPFFRNCARVAPAAVARDSEAAKKVASWALKTLSPWLSPSNLGQSF